MIICDHTVHTTSTECYREQHHSVLRHVILHRINVAVHLWALCLYSLKSRRILISLTYLEIGMNALCRLCKSAVYKFYIFGLSFCNVCMRPEFMAFVSNNSVCCILWHGLEQSVIDDAVDLWPIRSCVCVHANGGHFEHTVWLSICFLCILDEVNVSYYAWCTNTAAQKCQFLRVVRKNEWR